MVAVSCKVRNIGGQRFGRLMAKEVSHIRNKQSYWLCLCDCGKETIVRGDSLTSGKSTSCGCRRDEVAKLIRRTHGKSTTGAYQSWMDARSRCRNQNHPEYHNYGERGIQFSPAWDDFAVFLADMGDRPLGMSIDRIYNDGNYEPSNCRWATPRQQARNMRANRILHYKGEAMSMAEAAERAGLNQKTVFSRLRYGWTVEDALTRAVGA